MWKLTIEDDEGKQTNLPLAHDEYGVGRAESNNLRLTDRNISRNHAVLGKNGQGWFLRDLSSYNGTYVNGARVVGEQPLHSGDVVQLGDYRLELLDEGLVVPVVAGAAPPPVVPPVHQRPNRLVVVVGPSPGSEYPLDKEHFTIGRSEDATISINHSSVSRVHAELFALGNGRFEIVDKASANGIRINGVELKRGILEAGDALELGDVRLRFVGAGKIFRADMTQNSSCRGAGLRHVPLGERGRRPVEAQQDRRHRRGGPGHGDPRHRRRGHPRRRRPGRPRQEADRHQGAGQAGQRRDQAPRRQGLRGRPQDLDVHRRGRAPRRRRQLQEGRGRLGRLEVPAGRGRPRQRPEEGDPERDRQDRHRRQRGAQARPGQAHRDRGQGAAARRHLHPARRGHVDPRHRRPRPTKTAEATVVAAAARGARPRAERGGGDPRSYSSSPRSGAGARRSTR